MHEFSSHENKADLKELLSQYQSLRSGKNHCFIDEDSFEKIIDYFDEKDDLIKAIEVAETGLEYFPFSSLLLIKKADLLIALRNYNEALSILEKASLLDSADINIYILKTDALLALDMQPKAAELLEEALFLFEGDEKLDLLFELADVYDDYEEFDKVFDCLQLILEQDNENEEALYKICFWTDFTGRNEESIKLHQKIIDNYPYSELAWFNLGAAYQGLKLYEKSIDAYEFAVIINEKFDYAYRNMGDAFIRLRRYKEAIDVLEKVLQLTRPEEVIYDAIGHCYFRLRKYASARFNYRKASHMNPQESKLLYKIALTYMKEQQWEMAIKHLEAAMHVHSNVAEYNLAMGESLMQLQKFKEAIQYLSLVIRSKPKNVKAWEKLISCLYVAGYYDEALQQCAAALKATGEKPLFYYLQSAVLFSMNKNADALVQLQHGLNAAPRLLKKFNKILPSMLQNKQVSELIARYKKGRKF